MLSATIDAACEANQDSGLDLLPARHWAREEFGRQAGKSGAPQAGDTVVSKASADTVMRRIDRPETPAPVERLEIRHRYSGRVLRTMFCSSLASVNLSAVELLEADLAGANLRCADLTGAALSGADLRRANLSGANLAGANLSRALLAGAQLRGATYDSKTVWPRDFDLEASGAVAVEEPKQQWGWWWRGRG